MSDTKPGSDPTPGGGSRTIRGVQSIPIFMSAPLSPFVGGNAFVCTIQVSSLPPGSGTTVQVGCDHPGVFVSPSGVWPYALNYPANGGTTASFTINTNTVQSNTDVKVYACESGVDITNPNNWRVQQTITVSP